MGELHSRRLKRDDFARSLKSDDFARSLKRDDFARRLKIDDFVLLIPLYVGNYYDLIVGIHISIYFFA